MTTDLSRRSFIAGASAAAAVAALPAVPAIAKPLDIQFTVAIDPAFPEAEVTVWRYTRALELVEQVTLQAAKQIHVLLEEKYAELGVHEERIVIG